MSNYSTSLHLLRAGVLPSSDAGTLPIRRDKFSRSSRNRSKNNTSDFEQRGNRDRNGRETSPKNNPVHITFNDRRRKAFAEVRVHRGYELHLQDHHSIEAGGRGIPMCDWRLRGTRGPSSWAS